MGVSKEDFKGLEHKVTVLTGRTEHKLDELNHGIRSIAAGTAQNLAGIQANLSVMSDGLEQHDIVNQIQFKLILRLLERNAQLELMLTEGRKLEDITDIDRSKIRNDSKELLQLLFAAAKEEVTEEREAYIAELRAKAAEIEAQQKVEAEAAEQAKKEGEVAEEALRNAEHNLSNPGGQGSDIPAGVDTFGG